MKTGRGSLLKWRKALVRGRWAVFWYHSIIKTSAKQKFISSDCSPQYENATRDYLKMMQSQISEDDKENGGSNVKDCLDSLMFKEQNNRHVSLLSLAHRGDLNQNELSTQQDRADVVNNLRILNTFFGLPPDCFMLSVYFLDKFLTRVKAKQRHLAGVGLGCYHLATSLRCNVDQAPGLADLVGVSQCDVTQSDVSRLAKYISEKISLDQHIGMIVTPLDFLRVFYNIIARNVDVKGFQLEKIIAKLLVCQASYLCVKRRWSVLALSLIICELEDVGSEDLRWMSLLIGIQNYCKISDEEIVHCRSLVSDTVESYLSAPCVVPRSRLRWALSKRTVQQLRPPSTRVPLSSRLPTILENGADSTYDCSQLSSSPGDGSSFEANSSY